MKLSVNFRIGNIYNCFRENLMINHKYVRKILLNETMQRKCSGVCDMFQLITHKFV